MPALSLAPRDPAWITQLPSDVNTRDAIEGTATYTAPVVRERQATTSTAAAESSSPINTANQKPPAAVVGGAIVGSLVGFTVLVLLVFCWRYSRGGGSSWKGSQSSSLPSSPRPRNPPHPPPIAPGPHFPPPPPPPPPPPGIDPFGLGPGPGGPPPGPPFQPVHPGSRGAQVFLEGGEQHTMAEPIRSRGRHSTRIAEVEGYKALIVRRKKPRRVSRHRRIGDDGSTSSTQSPRPIRSRPRDPDHKPVKIVELDVPKNFRIPEFGGVYRGSRR